MKRLKVVTVLGTRPEIIRLSRVLAQLDAHCEHVLVHTGQNYDYELYQIFFDQLNLRPPDHVLSVPGASPAESIGNIIVSTDRVLSEVRPDAVLVLGDTNSCLAVIAAKRRRIPVFHMEAGNRCFDLRVPEEINRRIVDHVADVNLPYSDIAREYLLREGLRPDLVITTGSPMYEVLHHYRPGIDASAVLKELRLTPRQYFVVSAHREENVEPPASLQRIVTIVNALAQSYKFPVLFSVHPRTGKALERSGAVFDPLVQLHRPLGFLDYVKLQLEAYAVLSDSGTITEESSILNFPALNIRESHERPEGMEETSVMMVGLNVERVLQGLLVLQQQTRGAQRVLRMPNDYCVPNVSAKVVRIIHSYTDYVRRVVWSEFPGMPVP